MNTEEKKHQKNRELLAGGRKREAVGTLFVMLSATLFGIMPLITKVAYAHGSNAYTAAFGRFFFGSIFLFLLILVLPGYRLRIRREEIFPIVILSVFYALMPIMLYESYRYIDSGLAMSVHFVYPVGVVVFMALFFRKMPDKKQLLCVFLCMAGMFLASVTTGAKDGWGIFLAVVSGLVYSTYIIILGRSKGKEMPTLTLAFWMSALAAVGIGLVSFFMGQLRFDMDGTAWGSVALLGLLNTTIALVLFQKGVLMCGEVKASLLSTLEPLISIVVGLLVFKEELAGRKLAGVILILCSIVILVLPVKEKKKAADA